nr:protein of unknown function [Cupriavidus taiwanensis]
MGLLALTGVSAAFWLDALKSDPQCLHFMATANISSPQNLQRFVGSTA